MGKLAIILLMVVSMTACANCDINSNLSPECKAELLGPGYNLTF